MTIAKSFPSTKCFPIEINSSPTARASCLRPCPSSAIVFSRKCIRPSSSLSSSSEIPNGPSANVHTWFTKFSCLTVVFFTEVLVASGDHISSTKQEVTLRNLISVVRSSFSIFSRISMTSFKFLWSMGVPSTAASSSPTVKPFSSDVRKVNSTGRSAFPMISMAASKSFSCTVIWPTVISSSSIFKPSCFPACPSAVMFFNTKWAQPFSSHSSSIEIPNLPSSNV